MEVQANFYDILHFGVPCKSWGKLNTFNKGTRSKDKPEGTGFLAREILGNSQAEFVAQVCRLMVAMGKHFSIENPKGSFIFEFPAIKSLLDLPGVFLVHFDQCCYGLTLPGAGKNCFCKKPLLELSTRVRDPHPNRARWVTRPTG